MRISQNNIQGLNTKKYGVEFLLSNFNIDIFCINEVKAFKNFVFNGYKFFLPDVIRNCGGAGILAKDNLEIINKGSCFCD
jgi:exonuclease III